MYLALTLETASSLLGRSYCSLEIFKTATCPYRHYSYLKEDSERKEKRNDSVATRSRPIVEENKRQKPKITTINHKGETFSRAGNLNCGFSFLRFVNNESGAFRLDRGAIPVRVPFARCGTRGRSTRTPRP